eukprot:11575390-Karenia_brevis.AAC.1
MHCIDKPVRAKPVAKSKLKGINRAKASAPTPTTAPWLGPKDKSSSGTKKRGAGSPINPSSMRDTGSSLRNQGFTPFVADSVPVLKYSQVFPDH